MRFGACSVLSWAFGFSLLLVCGCGEPPAPRPPLAKVKGIVTFKGNPVGGAMVTFAVDKASRASVGITDEDGTFKLTTFDSNDGAIIGTNLITVTKAPPAGSGKALTVEGLAELAAREQAIREGRAPAPKGSDKPPESPIPAKYGSKKTSGLKEEVKAGEKHNFEIKLTD